MKKPSPITTATTAKLREILGDDPGPQELNNALRLLGKWRAHLLENTLVAQSGTAVQSGPFKGMTYDTRASEGSRVPRLLGCYEAPLAPVIEEIIAANPALIIDVGSAEGYYAVGFATRLPDTTVWARDTEVTAQERCLALAESNGVAGRVKVGGTLTHADFDICRAQHTVIICDIEGAEEGLMDPERAKGLRRADVLIEVHEGIKPGLCNTLEDRFAGTHRITRIARAIDTSALPDWMSGLSDMDRLLALWEWRASDTPWLWLQAKHR